MKKFKFNCTYTDNLDVVIEANTQEEAEYLIRNLSYGCDAERDRTVKRIRINKLTHIDGIYQEDVA